MKEMNTLFGFDFIFLEKNVLFFFRPKRKISAPFFRRTYPQCKPTYHNKQTLGVFFQKENSLLQQWKETDYFNLHFCNSVVQMRMSMKKEALVGRIYAGFMCQQFHCSFSNHPHSCLVLGRLIELLFLLISFQRVLQIFVLNKLNKCADTYDIPTLYKLETVTVLSST